MSLFESGVVVPTDVVPKSDSESNPPVRQYDESTVQKMIQDRLAKQAKKHASERAEFEDRLAQFEGGQAPTGENESVKPAKPNLESEYKQKLVKAEREQKALLEKLNKHRQSTLRQTVQGKLAEKDCLDPEIAFNDLHSRGLVKLDDDDNVVVEGLYDSLDQLVDEYLGKRDYLRKSKTTGGIGTIRPGISGGTTSQRDAIIAQVKAASQGNRLFGK